MHETKENRDLLRKPSWLKIHLPRGKHSGFVRKTLQNLNLNTVCDAANCPNRIECYESKTATFLIMGDHCTRSCTFCNIENTPPGPLDTNEPAHVAEAVEKLKLLHAVITSVTRDDLEDGGASHFAATIQAVRNISPETTIEVLIPDFQGDSEALDTVLKTAPEIVNHNIETVPALYHKVRPQANYQQSLKLLAQVKKRSRLISKSGIMLGLGEKRDEVLSVLHDLREADCDFVTIGQYIAPSNRHHPVIEYLSPETFAGYYDSAKKMGFRAVASAPLVRSSYSAGELLKQSTHHE